MFVIWRISSTQYKAASQSLKHCGYVLTRHLPDRLRLAGSPLLYHWALDPECPVKAVRVVSDTYVYPWFYHLEDIERRAEWYQQLPARERQALFRAAEATAFGAANKAWRTAPMRDFRVNPDFPSTVQTR